MSGSITMRRVGGAGAYQGRLPPFKDALRRLRRSACGGSLTRGAPRPW
jgi:hypothetical protein